MFDSGRELVPPPAQAGDAESARQRRRNGSASRSLLLVAVVFLLVPPGAAAVDAADAGAPEQRGALVGGAHAGLAPEAPTVAQSVHPRPGSAAAGWAVQESNESTTTSDDGSATESGTPSPDGTPVPTESATPTPTATSTAGASPTPTGTATTSSPSATATDPTPATEPVTSTTTSGSVFVVSNVTAPDGARVGEEVVVRTTVTNRGAAAGAERVNYSLAGEAAASERLSLAAGESARVTFRTEVSSLDPGTYVHGVRNATGDGVAVRLRVTPDVDLDVSALDAPTEISRGDSYVVLATVANPAETAITRNVSYTFDGVTVATKRVTVDPGATERVAFESSVADVARTTGEVANGSTHTHAVVSGSESRAGGEVLVRRGAAADPSALAVEEFRTGDDLRPGETLRVNLSVRNVGEVVFEGQVTYRIDGSPVDTEWVRVSVGEQRALSFAVTHDALDSRDVLTTAGETSHGVWVGETDLRTRPVTVHGPFETPTEAGTVTFTDRAGSERDDRGTGTGSAARPTPDESCERGLISPCGGTGLDETTLTLIGIATSMLGILYEMVQG